MKTQKENSLGNITWSEMGKQNMQAKKVYFLSTKVSFIPVSIFMYNACKCILEQTPHFYYDYHLCVTRSRSGDSFINQVTMLSRATRSFSVITFRPLTSLLNNIFAGFIAHDIRGHHECKLP